MGSLSIWHWLIVLLIVALVFGTKKLRNIGTDLGGAAYAGHHASSDAVLLMIRTTISNRGPV